VFEAFGGEVRHEAAGKGTGMLVIVMKLQECKVLLQNKASAVETLLQRHSKRLLYDSRLL